MPDEYRGVLGAFPYALRASESWLFRSYVLVSGLAALVVALVVTLGLVVLIGRTAGAAGGSFTLSRAFYVVVGLFVVLPTLAPTLFVARRHRHGTADARYDAAMALAGYAFLASLYVGLVVTVPPSFQEPTTGALGPLVAFLYGLPPLAGLVPPVVAVAVMWLVHRLYR